MRAGRHHIASGEFRQMKSILASKRTGFCSKLLTDEDKTIGIAPMNAPWRALLFNRGFQKNK